MATKILTATALMLGISFSAFAGTPKTEAKTDAKAPAKVETATPAKTDAKTQTTTTLYYWFDANTQQYIGHLESAGCPNEPAPDCAYGYISVDDPVTPVKPDSSPDLTETDRKN